ncbi:type II toxin-antitoxin system HicA family toxin [Bacillus mycoides]|uniref:type II toxin-antitoxin system HicA family toxin n=1 Tax=Bacillus mycoides TaxID=1405 RepID=UPI001642F506|nr:type II toxin-antitoxin system HicA family toxin [Bacillus mycoides]
MSYNNSKYLYKLAEEYDWIAQPRKKRGKDGHVIFKKPGVDYMVSFQHPEKDIPTGTARKIIKQIKGLWR